MFLNHLKHSVAKFSSLPIRDALCKTPDAIEKKRFLEQMKRTRKGFQKKSFQGLQRTVRNLEDKFTKISQYSVEKRKQKLAQKNSKGSMERMARKELLLKIGREDKAKFQLKKKKSIERIRKEMDEIRTKELVVPLITKSLAGGAITSEEEVAPGFLFSQKPVENLPRPGCYNLLKTDMMRLKDEALKPHSPLAEEEMQEVRELMLENEAVDAETELTFEVEEATNRVQFVRRNFFLWRELVGREELHYGLETRMRVLEDLEERLIEFKEFGEHLEMLVSEDDSEFLGCLEDLGVDELKSVEKYYREILIRNSVEKKEVEELEENVPELNSDN